MKAAPEHTVPAPAAPGSSRMITTMGLIGLISSILLVATYVVTLPYIEANQAAYLESAISEVLPGIHSRRTYRIIGDTVVPDDEGTNTDGVRLFAGFDSLGVLQGFAIDARGQGYADVILLIYGYSPECRCIVGMKVLESRETPGLGDKILKDPEFLSNFEALDVRWSEESGSTEGPVQLVKKGAGGSPWQIDGISGATISSQAITDILNASNEVVLRVIHSNLENFTPKTDVQ